MTLDYGKWLQRVVGWDAVLPCFVSAGSMLISGVLKNQPPADILALVFLPVLAFVARLVVGMYQIRGNMCGRFLRRLQFCSLVLALFILAFVDFFIALVAFVPNGRGPGPAGMMPLYVITFTVYATLVAFAMYPGRQPDLPYND